MNTTDVLIMMKATCNCGCQGFCTGICFSVLLEKEMCEKSLVKLQEKSPNLFYFVFWCSTYIRPVSQKTVFKMLPKWPTLH